MYYNNLNSVKGTAYMFIKLRFPQVYPVTCSKVEIIKSIRRLTGMGLKESKDFCEIYSVAQDMYLLPEFDAISVQDSLIPGTHSVPIQAEILRDALCCFRRAGVEIFNDKYRILQDLRKLAQDALDIADDELAQEIMMLVMAEKLRNPTYMLDRE
jgi:hypothetical protein